ncbi:DNA-directed RNA polymerase II core subunit rpb9 [Didymella heteroderae]|uniref:DNA-directed RNA polymerase II core subunit rpb9 n=1 Tax=Didymella heteroderae TaxID=1769908 RepID=A0A9P5BUY7_9PLEO|nr:DNA-directed RNA polymerase II core subunit rpb9 [Didymella heteroderae]
MSSPAADYGSKEPAQDPNKQILFRFCSECSNLLFPREDKAENKLLFACRTCSFTEEAPSSCVMRHEIASTVGATAGVTAEVAQDPTVGASNPTSQNAAAQDKDKEVTCCTMCGQDIMCNVCGEDWAPGFMLEAEDEPSHVEPQFYMEHDYEFYDDDFFDDEDMEDVMS